MAHIKGRKQSRETVSEETQMLDIPDKNFQSSVTNTFKDLMNTMPKKLKKYIKISHQVEIFNKKQKLFFKL